MNGVLVFMLICKNCLKDEFLKDHLQDYPQKGQCVICRGEGHTVTNIESEEFQNLFKAVVRYHYAEYHYNNHWGGAFGIQDLMLNANPIIEHRFHNEVDSDLLYTQLPRVAYAKDDNSVSLYYGFDEYTRGLFTSSLQKEESKIISTFERELKEKNHYLVEEKVKVLLEPLANKIENKFSIGSSFYRARIGFEKRYADTMNPGFDKLTYYYEPYREGMIQAPPPPKASAGRLNRQGISYLYLSSDISTAVSEVRPHPGHLVSVGKFILSREVRIADLRNINLRKFCTDEKIEKFVLLNSIGRKFSLPITPEERDQYLITQLFADTFRLLGFDGISFKSSVSDGYNVVLFDANVCKYTSEESDVLFCEEVKYSIRGINGDVVFNEQDFEEY